MEPISASHVLIDNKRIAFGVHGNGEPVVLVHGTPSSSLIWRNILPNLLGAGYKVHVFDLLGYGLSERPWDPSIDTSISAQVPIPEGLLKHWNLESTHLVAHDIGGAVSQRFAIFSPERIRSLTIIDVVSFDSYPSQRTKEQMKNGLEALIKTDAAEHRAHFKDWLLTAVHDPKKLTESSLKSYLDYISGPVGQASLFQHQIQHYDPKHTMEIADRIHELGELPVKLIWGANDAWQVVDWAHKLQKSISNAELDNVENCGHFSPEDQPEKIAELLLDFLKRQTTVSDGEVHLGT